MDENLHLGLIGKRKKELEMDLTIQKIVNDVTSCEDNKG